VELSVNCMTRGPGHRVAALLGLLREVADEILVAVDDRAAPDVAAEVATVADRVVLYPYAEPVDRPLPWLHAACRGRWVLTIDDDEIPSARLLEQLPALVREERVTHYWLRRRWLYPDRDSFLDAPPWRPDYLLRLVRNDRRLLRFPVVVHRPIDALGPCRYLEAALYHLDCIEQPLDARERKAAKYEALEPGLRAAGLPLNRAYYLPELRPGTPLAEVPQEDRALIAQVLDAEPSEPQPVAAPRVTRAEIDALWEGRALSEGDYAARIELVENVTLYAGQPATVDVELTNLGAVSWPWGDAEPAVRLVARWPDLPGAEELRTTLPAELRPGESQLVPVEVAPPPDPGAHRLVLDLVHEHRRWFECGVELAVEVLPSEERPAPSRRRLLPRLGARR
jgi:hypothetical protein